MVRMPSDSPVPTEGRLIFRDIRDDSVLEFAIEHGIARGRAATGRQLRAEQAWIRKGQETWALRLHPEGEFVVGTSDEFTVDFPAPGVAEVEILDADDGTPIAGAEVQLLGVVSGALEAEFGAAPGSSARSDANGIVRLGPGFGVGIARVRARDYTSALAVAAFESPGKRQIRLRRGGRAVVQVLGAALSEREGLRVFAIREDDRQGRSEIARVTPTGTAEFLGLAPGRYRLTCVRSIGIPYHPIATAVATVGPETQTSVDLTTDPQGVADASLEVGVYAPDRPGEFQVVIEGVDERNAAWIVKTRCSRIAAGSWRTPPIALRRGQYLVQFPDLEETEQIDVSGLGEKLNLRPSERVTLRPRGIDTETRATVDLRVSECTWIGNEFLRVGRVSKRADGPEDEVVVGCGLPLRLGVSADGYLGTSWTTGPLRAECNRVLEPLIPLRRGCRVVAETFVGGVLISVPGVQLAASDGVPVDWSFDGVGRESSLVASGRYTVSVPMIEGASPPHVGVVDVHSDRDTLLRLDWTLR